MIPVGLSFVVVVVEEEDEEGVGFVDSMFGFPWIGALFDFSLPCMKGLNTFGSAIKEEGKTGKRKKARGD